MTLAPICSPTVCIVHACVPEAVPLPLDVAMRMLTTPITSTATTAVAMYQPRLDERWAGGGGLNAGCGPPAIAGTGVGVLGGPTGGPDGGPTGGPEGGDRADVHGEDAALVGGAEHVLGATHVHALHVLGLSGAQLVQGRGVVHDLDAPGCGVHALVRAQFALDDLDVEPFEVAATSRGEVVQHADVVAALEERAHEIRADGGCVRADDAVG